MASSNGSSGNEPPLLAPAPPASDGGRSSVGGGSSNGGGMGNVTMLPLQGHSGSGVAPPSAGGKGTGGGRRRRAAATGTGHSGPKVILPLAPRTLLPAPAPPQPPPPVPGAAVVGPNGIALYPASYLSVFPQQVQVPLAPAPLPPPVSLAPAPPPASSNNSVCSTGSAAAGMSLLSLEPGAVGRGASSGGGVKAPGHGKGPHIMPAPAPGLFPSRLGPRTYTSCMISICGCMHACTTYVRLL